MENVNWLELIVMIVAGGVTLFGLAAWLIKKGGDVIARKIEAGLERGADLIDGAAIVARGAGFEKVADIMEEVADPLDEGGDVFGALAAMVEDQDFTKERLLGLVKEGKEVGLEAKDFWVKIIKKPVIEEPITE